MQSKMERIAVPKRTDYSSVQFDKQQKIKPLIPQQLTSEEEAQLSSLDPYYQLIYPWKQVYSLKTQQYFFVNRRTSERSWTLPTDLVPLLDRYFLTQALSKKRMSSPNIDLFIEAKQLGFDKHSNSTESVTLVSEGKEEEDATKREVPEPEVYMKDYKTGWFRRPAPIQRMLSSDERAYHERDQEYNIWYDKYIEDELIVQKDGSKFKCNPAVHSGYTKADVYNRQQRHFCIHFARGNCFMGASCGYHHHVPSLEECLKVDHNKDVFGRVRFSSHRRDNAGIGSFLKETRTLKVSEFCVPVGCPNSTEATYEMLWRHFGQWGTIEDIFLVPSLNIAYIRFENRAMAEYAKVAMSCQNLDAEEILKIQWVDNDSFKMDQVEHQEWKASIEEQRLKKMSKKEKEKLRKKGDLDGNLGVHSNSQLDEKQKYKLTMDEFYREEALNIERQEELRRKKGHFAEDGVEAHYTLIEQRLKQAESDRLKLSSALRSVHGSGNQSRLNFQRFIKRAEGTSEPNSEVELFK